MQVDDENHEVETDFEENFVSFLEMGLSDQLLKSGYSYHFQKPKEIEDLTFTICVAGHIQK